MVANRDLWGRYLRTLSLPAVAVLALVTVACGSGEPKSLEERAQSIDKSLICPICPSETIDQAQVELATQMRGLVREKLAEGWTREQILQLFVDSYGEKVLAAPRKSGVSIVAWVVPPGVIAGGIILLFFVVRAMGTVGRGGREDTHPVEQELEPYLSRVDREIGLSHEELPGGERDG